MTKHHETPDVDKAGEVASVTMLLARLTWILLGPIGLLLLGLGIVRSGAGWLTLWDAAFVILIGLMIVCRWFEMRSGRAMTAYGEPLTQEHFRRYVGVLLSLGLVGWVAVNIAGNHVLT